MDTIPDLIRREQERLLRLEAAMDLPLPRLQLRWERGANEHELICHYEFVVRVGKHDCRDDAFKLGFAKASFGTTRSTCHKPGGYVPFFPDGTMETPFRDGAHAAWDSHRLGIPAYVIYENHYQLVEPRRDLSEDDDGPVQT